MKSKIGSASLAAMALFGLTGAMQKADATAVMLPYVEGGNGVFTAITYINRSGSSLHITYQLKDLGNLTDACTHQNSTVETSANDVTTFIYDGGAGPSSDPTVRPGEFGDTVGGGYAPVLKGAGFAILQNGDDTPDSLTAEAHIIDTTTGAVYSVRALEMYTSSTSINAPVYELAASAGENNSNVLWNKNSTTCTAPTNYSVSKSATAQLEPCETGFHFFPEAVADTSIYAIAIDNGFLSANALKTSAATDLTSLNYGVEVTLASAVGGSYNRIEVLKSFATGTKFKCAAVIPLEKFLAAGWMSQGLNLSGGWFPLTVLNTGDGGEAVIPYKVEAGASGTGYGATTTPLVPQFYAR